MKNILFIFLALMTLCFSSCREDSITPEEETEIPGPTVIVKSNVSGIVVDNLNGPAPDVIVQLGSEMVETDENGYFRFVNASVDQEGGLLKFSKAGFFENFKFVTPELNETAHIKVQLVERTLRGNFNTQNGGTIDLNGDAQLSMPADAIVTETGETYTGTVNVYAHWFNPKDQDISLNMPGDLRGLISDNEVVQLATFGMMGVELESSTGQELQLKDGFKASLFFPLSNDLLNVAESTIPLWHFDEVSGVWIEEGIAVLDGDNYVAEVAHFSFWNCDYPYPLINITGVLETSSGAAVQNNLVEIQVQSGVQSGYGWTNDQGRFEGKVPANENLTLIVKAFCNGLASVIHTQDINASSTDIDLGTITVDLGIDAVEFIGQVECTMQAATEGYVLLSFGNNMDVIVDIDAQGNFSASLDPCGANTVTVTAYDLTGPTTSIPFTETIDDPIENLGIIEACTPLDEYITVKRNNVVSRLYQDVGSYILDGSTTLIRANNSPDEGFELEFPLVDLGTEDAVYMHHVLEGSGGNFWNFICFTNSVYGACDALNVDVTMYDYTSGYIEGTMTGRITFGTIDDDIDVEFRVKIGDAINTASITGRVWEDANEDGLRQATETNVAGLEMIPNSTIGRSQHGAQTKTDGTYEIFGFIPDQVVLTGYTFDQATLLNVGTDETIDNDFISSPGGFEANVTIDLTQINDAQYIDLGTIPGIDLICSNIVTGCGNSAVVEILATGGTLPYSYSINGITINTNQLSNLPPGVNSYNVTDANGFQCFEDFVIEENNNQVSGRLWVDQPGGQDDLYDQGIDTPLAGVTLKMLGMPWQTSDANGLYVFNEVISNAADNVLEVEPPAGYELLVPNVGSNDTIDSDFGENQANAVHLLFDDCNKQYIMDAGFKQI